MSNRNVQTFISNAGIGLEVSHQELLDIASPGDDYTPQYVFSVNNFNALYSIVSQLVALTCDGKSYFVLSISSESEI